MDLRDQIRPIKCKQEFKNQKVKQFIGITIGNVQTAPIGHGHLLMHFDFWGKNKL